jgi:cystathionine beta-synthase
MGLAIAAAVKGYKMVFTMPEKMSQEKQDALRGLGATVLRTPTEYPRDHLYGYLGVAFSLADKLNEKKERKIAHVLNQYKNPGNPMAHYNETGLEIWEQCEGKIDYVIIGAGTGGTIKGIARRLKEFNPNIKIIGVDPPGSVLALPEQLNIDNPVAPGGQIIEGVGYDFQPRCFDRVIVDDWIKGPDKESFIMARRLMK